MSTHRHIRRRESFDEVAELYDRARPGYPQRLIDDLEGLDWSRAIKDMQRNWVGRSEGAEIQFRVDEPGSRRARGGESPVAD